MLSELVYVSDRQNLGNDREIRDILEVCQRNNSGKITGALLYSLNKFVQYLEGDYNDVKSTFEKIKLDPRHRNVQLVVFSPIKTRIFPGWAMAEKELEDQIVNFKSNVTGPEREIFIKLLKGEIEEDHTLSKIIRTFFE